VKQICCPFLFIVPVHQLPFLSIVSVLRIGREGKGGREGGREGGEDNKPLYLIVSKFKPTRFGSRKSLRVASHVPSPTYMVFELYVLLPGGERLSWGAIVAAKELCSGAHPLRPAAALVNSLFGPLDRTMYCVEFAMSGLLSIAVGMRSVERNGCSSRAPSGVCVKVGCRCPAQAVNLISPVNSARSSYRLPSNAGSPPGHDSVSDMQMLSS